MVRRRLENQCRPAGVLMWGQPPRLPALSEAEGSRQARRGVGLE